MDIEKLLQDEEFVKAIEAAEEDAEVIRLFGEKGITVTDEDVAAFRAEAAGELSEKGLSEVAGGIIYPWRPISPRNNLVEWLIRKLFG